MTDGIESGTVDIVFLQMGGPATEKEVRGFLRELFKDPYIIQLPNWMKRFQGTFASFISIFRSKGTRSMYRKIGGGSPILEITQNFADKVMTKLEVTNHKFRTHVLMRYTEPRSDKIVSNLTEVGAEVIVLYPLYPHFSKTTTGSSLKDFTDAFWAQYLGKRLRLLWVEEWSQEDFYIDWWVSGVHKIWEKLSEKQKESAHIIFSAHGLPEKYVERGDPYLSSVEECKRIIDQRLRETGVNVGTTLSFQSQVGPVEWIRPYTTDVIVELAEKDIQTLIVVPLGFVSDHIETLYEIDVLYREEAMESGIQDYYSVSPPNASDEFAQGVATHIIKRLQEEEIL